MANTYLSVSPVIESRKLKVQEVAIPFTITANATPASKTFTCDEPAALFFQFEGLNNITVASGACDTSAEAAAAIAALATPTDSTGIFGILLKVGQPVTKIVGATLTSRTGTAENVAQLVVGTTTLGDKILIQGNSAINFATTNVDSYLTISWV